MGDEPSFPSPNEAKRKAANARITPPEPKAAVVVQHAEPMPESKSESASPGRAKLSPDEVRALLAVSEVNRPRRAMWRRGRTIAVPTIALSVVAHLFLAYWYVAVALLVAGAVVWTVGPWRKRDDW